MLLIITIGYDPFRGSIMKVIEENIAMGTFNIPNYVSGQFGNIIHQILTVSPEKSSSMRTSRDSHGS